MPSLNPAPWGRSACAEARDGATASRASTVWQQRHNDPCPSSHRLARRQATDLAGHSPWLAPAAAQMGQSAIERSIVTHPHSALPAPARTSSAGGLAVPCDKPVPRSASGRGADQGPMQTVTVRARRKLAAPCDGVPRCARAFADRGASLHVAAFRGQDSDLDAVFLQLADDTGLVSPDALTAAFAETGTRIQSRKPGRDEIEELMRCTVGRDNVEGLDKEVGLLASHRRARARPTDAPRGRRPSSSVQNCFLCCDAWRASCCSSSSRP